MSRSQPELLFHVHLKEPLVDSLACFHFGTEQGVGGGGVVKKSLFIITIINYAYFHQTIQYQVFALDIGPETEAQKIGKTGLQLTRFSKTL